MEPNTIYLIKRDTGRILNFKITCLQQVRRLFYRSFY